MNVQLVRTVSRNMETIKRHTLRRIDRADAYLHGLRCTSTGHSSQSIKFRHGPIKGHTCITNKAGIRLFSMFTHPARKCYTFSHFYHHDANHRSYQTSLNIKRHLIDIAICRVIAENEYTTHYTHRGMEFDIKNHSSENII